MTTRSDAEAVFERYLTHHAATELESTVALFEPDATVEDPVGGEVHRGIEAIREFYAGTQRRNGTLSIERIGPALFGGAELAAHVRAGLDREGAPPPMDVIYTITIGSSGRIAGLRAWY